MLLSVVYVALQRILQLVSLLFRSSDCGSPIFGSACESRGERPADCRTCPSDNVHDSIAHRKGSSHQVINFAPQIDLTLPSVAKALSA